MNKNETNYSILMSVYYKEKPEYLKAAIQSMLDQSIKSGDFVLVCDGPLTDGLEDVIREFKSELNVVRLEKNSGLGVALNEGLAHCRYELVARMDSDDISLKDRCALQLSMFEKDPDLGFASGIVEEFSDSPDEVTGMRTVPQDHAEILKFARKRNPVNHPCVMFKKSEVTKAGGYTEDFHLFEDYNLWVRMLLSGTKAANSGRVLLKMRTPADAYKRRGGAGYAREMLRFHRWLLKIKFSSAADFLTGALPHAAVCILPAGIRRYVYKLLR